MATRYGASEIQRRLRPQPVTVRDTSRAPTYNPGGLTSAQKAYGPSGNQEVSRQATARLTANLPNMQSRGGGGGGGGGGLPAQNIQPIPTVQAPRMPRLSDFRMPDFRDPEYNAQIASLNRALQDFETGAQQRAERYGIDYLQGVRNIGYRPSPGFVAMPNILEAGEEEAAPMAARAVMGAEEPDATAGMQGMWDIEGRFDPYSAAARGTRGLRDEFAARGTLRSSDFGQTFGEFQNRLNEQLEAMETGRTRFAEDLSRELAQQRAGTEERRQAAERAALGRAATAQMNAYLQALAGG